MENEFKTVYNGVFADPDLFNKKLRLLLLALEVKKGQEQKT